MSTADTVAYIGVVTGAFASIGGLAGLGIAYRQLRDNDRNQRDLLDKVTRLVEGLNRQEDIALRRSMGENAVQVMIWIFDSARDARYRQTIDLIAHNAPLTLERMSEVDIFRERETDIWWLIYFFECIGRIIKMNLVPPEVTDSVRANAAQVWKAVKPLVEQVRDQREKEIETTEGMTALFLPAFEEFVNENARLIIAAKYLQEEGVELPSPRTALQPN